MPCPREVAVQGGIRCISRAKRDGRMYAVGDFEIAKHHDQSYSSAVFCLGHLNAVWSVILNRF